MTFTYARGPHMSSTAVPSSAFSKGDLLEYNGNSSLSRLREPGGSATASGIIGVAEASSLESLNDQVPYTLALEGTVFLASAISTSQLNPGDKRDVGYTDSFPDTRFVVHSSTNTPQVVIMPPGSEDMIDSARSVVLVRFDPQHTIWGS